MNKECLIDIADKYIQWWGPNTTGSEPIKESLGTTLTKVTMTLNDLAKSRKEYWDFRFSFKNEY